MATNARYLDRKLVRNIIRHTDTHNRLQEEAEMWRDRERQVFGPHGNGARVRRGGGGRDQWQTGGASRLDPHPSYHNPLDRSQWSDGQRNRDIYRAELGSQERWGHTGFMELYPEEFINKESMDEMSNEDKEADPERRKKKKRTKKTTDSNRKRKHDADKKKKKKRTSGKRRKRQESSSSSSSSSSLSSDSSSSSSSSEEGEEEAPCSKDRRIGKERDEHSQTRPTKSRRDRDRRPPSSDDRFYYDSKGPEWHKPAKKNKEEEEKEEGESRRDKSRRRTDHRSGVDRESYHRVHDGKRERHSSAAQSREARPKGSTDRPRLHSQRTEDGAGVRDRRGSRSEKHHRTSPTSGSRRSEASKHRSETKDGRSDRHRQHPSHNAPGQDGREGYQGSRKDQHGKKR